MAIATFSYAQVVWDRSTTDTSKIHNLNSGNVGIGTITPNSKLEIITNSTYGDEIGAIKLKSSTANQFVYASYLDAYEAGSIQVIKPGITAQSLVLNPQGGNVGIGTPSPNFKLEVKGNALFGSEGAASGLSNYTNTIGVVGDGTSASSAAGIQFGDNASSSSRQWGIYNSFNTTGASLGSLNFVVSPAVNTDALTGTTVMTLSRVGYVGIGTPGPNMPLDIKAIIQTGYTSDVQAWT